MNTVAIMPVRNEDWVLGLSARAALLWCDELIVLDHASVLGVECGDYWDDADSSRITILRQPDFVWDEMRDRQWLLDVARQHGATHVVTIDADELITGNLLPRMREFIERTPSHATFELAWIQLRGGIDRMHIDGLWSKQWATTAFRDGPGFHWKPGPDGYQHHHREPYGMNRRCYRPVEWGQGGLFHLQMANERRLRSKQLWYTLVERLRWPNRKTAEQIRSQYSPTVYGSAPASIPAQAWYPEHSLARVPEEWWKPYAHLLKYLHLDTTPWQEAECRRIVSENPHIADGLDTFGVDLYGCMASAAIQETTGGSR